MQPNDSSFSGILDLSYTQGLYTDWRQHPAPHKSISSAEAGFEIELLEFPPKSNTFQQDVLQGLTQRPRAFNSKYFYDEIGSRLFDKICELDEYYLTRTELAIMNKYAGEIAEELGPDVTLVEYGSGSSIKTRLLLESLIDPVAYVPVDISLAHLRKSAQQLAREFPHIEVLPVYADFTQEFHLPIPSRSPARSTPARTAVYFPGSTIGNFHPPMAQELLQRTRNLCGRGGSVIIGIDLQKDPVMIEAAYNDAKGITAKFNLNLLHRINRELDANIDVVNFLHRARYNSEVGRIETDIISRCRQTITIGNVSFELKPGEAIRTEHSYKYTMRGFAELAFSAGLKLQRYWTDDRSYFGVLHLRTMN